MKNEIYNYTDPKSRRTIYFTGIDRVGKTTVRKLYSVESGQFDITFDRSPIDNLVYDEVFRNMNFSDRYINDFIKFNFNKNSFIVFMKLDFKEINRRYKKTEGGHYRLDELSTVENAFFKFLNRADKFGVRTIRINCDNMKPEEIVKEVEHLIRRFE